MKLSAFIFTLLFVLPACAQDTIVEWESYLGLKRMTILYKDRSESITRDIKGRLLDQLIAYPNNDTTEYSTFYTSGKPKMKLRLINGIPSGSMTVFSSAGRKVAELNYSDGQLMDTLFLKKDLPLLTGRMSYTSIVYGGMEREDGSSNVQEISGFTDFRPFTIREKEKGSCSIVFTDRFGFIIYFPTLSECTLSVFPDDYCDPTKTYREQPGQKWDCPDSITFSPDRTFQHLNTHFLNVGYAP